MNIYNSEYFAHEVGISKPTVYAVYHKWQRGELPDAPQFEDENGRLCLNDTLLEWYKQYYKTKGRTPKTNPINKPEFISQNTVLSTTDNSEDTIKVPLSPPTKKIDSDNITVSSINKIKPHNEANTITKTKTTDKNTKTTNNLSSDSKPEAPIEDTPPIDGIEKDGTGNPTNSDWFDIPDPFGLFD